MRKWIALVLAGVVLFAGGFGLGYYYAGLNEPVRSVVESDSVTEVYEEFPVSKLTTIRLTLKNSLCNRCRFLQLRTAVIRSDYNHLIPGFHLLPGVQMENRLSISHNPDRR